MNLLYKLQDNAFNIFVFMTYFVYFASIIGAFSVDPKFMDTIDFYAKLYICLFLLIRFNPIRKKIKFTELDRKISFSAGVFLLTTVIINGLVTRYNIHIKKMFPILERQKN